MASPLTVTATQGGATTGGMMLQIRVLTNAKVPALQTGAAVGVQSATPNISIIPSATGSLTYASLLMTDATSPTTEAGNTSLANASNPGLIYVSYKSSGATTSGTPLLMGSSTGTGIAISAVEILAAGSGSPSEWPTQPTRVSGGTASVNMSVSSSPPGGLLVAMVASNGSVGTTTMTISDTWGLTWTCLQQENGNSHGYAGIWVAQLPAFLPLPLYVNDLASRGTVTNAQSVNYTAQSTRSLILCCASIYSSNGSVSRYDSISDNAGNTWHYAAAANQLPPYASNTKSGQVYSTFIAWTWQDKGIATLYTLNFTGTAFANMDVSEWSGIGSVHAGAAAAGTAGSANLAGPTAPLVTGCIGVGITNTLSGSLNTGNVTASNGIVAASIPNGGVSNFIVFSSTGAAGQFSPYGFTWNSFGSSDDYASSLLILAPPGVPTGSFFALT